MLGFFAIIVSTSFFCLAASKPASVTATTSMPRRANSSCGAADRPRRCSPTACARRAPAVYLPSLILASSSGVSVTLDAGTAVSPFGPVVVPATASDAAQIAAEAIVARASRCIVVFIVLPPNEAGRCGCLHDARLVASAAAQSRGRRRRGDVKPYFAASSTLCGGVAVERLLPAVGDVRLGDGDRRSDDEGRRRLAEQAVAADRRHGAAELIGLVGDERGDVAVLDHVERDRLGKVERDDLRLGVAGGTERREDALRGLGPGDVDAVEVGVLGQERVGDLFGAGRIGDALLRDDLDVGIVLLDRRLEGVVALVGDVVLRVVEDPGDLALLADRRGERVGGLLAHLEEIVGDDADIVLALRVAGRDVRQEHDLDAALDGRLERLADVVGSSGRARMTLGCLASTVSMSLICFAESKPASVVGDHLDAEPGEFILGAGSDRIHEVRRGVPEEGGCRLHLLDLAPPRRR